VQNLSTWAQHIGDPVVLVGFAALLFFSIIPLLLGKTRSNAFRGRLVLYCLGLSGLVVIVGFVLACRRGTQKGGKSQQPGASGANGSPVVATEGEMRCNVSPGSASAEGDGRERNDIGSQVQEDALPGIQSHPVIQETETHGEQSPAVSAGDRNSVSISYGLKEE